MSAERQMTTLEKLAVEAALTTPVRIGKYNQSVSVPREIVEDIRRELDRLGIDWRDLHAKTTEIANRRAAEAAGRKAS